MKSAGIITFHRAVNYGAVIQTWALTKFLTRNNIQAFVLDYRSKFIDDSYKIFSWRKFKGLDFIGKLSYSISRLLNANQIRKRTRAFSSFVNAKLPLLPLSNIYKIDFCITGSDQVWNPYLTGGLDKFYLLDDISFEGKNKIAYAISGEPSCISSSDIEIIRASTYDYKCISVRENTLKHSFDDDEHSFDICVDPTFLLDETDYEELDLGNIVGKPYVFVFQVVKSAQTALIAKHIAVEMGLKVIFLNSRFDAFQPVSNIKRPIGPKEFISLIKHASYVITTSFHGTALSIILKKQFICIKTGNTNRQQTLLDNLNLGERFIDTSSIDKLDSIDYSKINLDKYAESSKAFLLNAVDRENSKVTNDPF